MLELLNECLKPTNNMVKNLVKVQDAYINTNHPDFMGGANSIFNMFDPTEQTNKAKEVAKHRLTIERLDNEEIQQVVAERKVSPNQEQLNFEEDQQKANQSNLQNEERVKDFDNYEVNKYMQKNVQPVRMQKMTNFKRAEDDDPGQSA